MSKETKLIPELRFPEFEKDGEWRFRQLGEIANVVASGDLDKGSFSLEPTDEHIFPIYSNSISNEGLYGYNTYAKYQPNSITITARGTLGVAFVRHTEFVGIGRLLVVSELEDIDPIYLKENWNHYARVPLENGGIPQLTAIKAKRVSLLFPKFKEQQKLASCLSSLDELIAAHSDKLETLKDHKKGLMQNLFPQKGQKVPNYRFPEFENDGELMDKELGKICNMQAGKFVKASEIFENRVDSLFPCYGGNGLRGYTKSFTHKGKHSLIGRQGALCGNITHADGQFHATEHAVVVTPEKNVDTGWLFHTLVSLNLNQYATGQAQPGLSVVNLEKVELHIPKSESEQQKIASCLSSLDDLINEQSENIEQLQQHKKGLMQGLFPNTK